MKNSGPVVYIIIWFVVIGFGSIFFAIKSKRGVCSAYYPEISLISCFFSNYGLPPARGK